MPINIDTSFTLCDEHTVKKLLKDSPELLPNYPEEKAVNRGIDLAYGKEQISASVTSGILQGKSIPDIANDLQNRIETMNRNSAIRVARTACTEAENAGRLDSYIEAQGMGIDLQKQWMATSDDRTRPTHAEADGQVVDIDKSFEVGSDELMFPGDPSGSPAEIYNCRCTMVSVLKQEEAQEEVEETEESTEQYHWEPAETLEEAEAYARDVLGFSDYDWKGMTLEYANMINKETTAIYNEFGNLAEAGVLSGFRMINKRVDWVACYTPGWGAVFVKNSTHKNAITNMAKDAKIEKGYGFWSSGEAEASIRHELGHAVQKWKLGEAWNKSGEIDKIRQSIYDKCGITKWSMDDSMAHIQAAGDYLSYYGLKSTGEFIAESVAEYMAGSARETAQSVVDILKR